MKAFSRNRQALKQSISNPIQHIIHADNDGRPQMARASEDAASSLNTTSDAAHLSRKISNLMYAANLETSERPARHEDDNTSRADSRTHRSRRGRNAFARAGKAIAQRFSNNTDKRSRKVLQESDVLCPSNIDPLVRKDETTNDTEHNRLSRRIAEGTNLGNPKIRSLTGDGNVPRKPLPVYESMKRLSQSDKSAEHRFSGSHLSYTGSSRHGSSNFDIDFNSRKSRPTSMQETLILHGLREDPRPPVPDLSPVEAEQPPRFSETISGLAQHPNVDFFSSSPEGSSTPRVRLERTYTPDGKKRLTALHSSAPSLLDFSFEDKNVGSSGDELAIPADTKLAKSQSVKRKTAKEDLRTVAARPSKKSKKTTITSPEEMVLASGIDKLDTHDPGALRSKDSNKKVSGVRREGSKGKGLGIFDTSKMKDSQSPPSAAAKKLRRRPSRRPSIPKRVSKISARDRRASGVLTPTSKNKEEGGDRDGTDVDDLQLDLSEYKVGTKDR
ncbi:hypothetical protein MMC16_000731 [Acarospora aff. strigata]|nr:hypothetical protein [Acarospora aff. strigata]